MAKKISRKQYFPDKLIVALVDSGDGTYYLGTRTATDTFNMTSTGGQIQIVEYKRISEPVVAYREIRTTKSKVT